MPPANLSARLPAPCPNVSAVGKPRQAAPLAHTPRVISPGSLAAVVALATAGAACARPMQGTSERRLVVAGVTRTYLLHAGGEAKPGRPLVLVLHGMAAAPPRWNTGRAAPSTSWRIGTAR